MPFPLSRTHLAIAVMIVTPLFFSSNLIFGRSGVAEVAPFTLAFLRWLAVGLILSPLVLREADAVGRLVRHHWRFLALLAFLGMWICGGVVYLGLTMTTATNGTLIYTASPVIILLMEAAFRGRRIRIREAAGAAVAFLGVAAIVLKGDPAALLALKLNTGDVLMLMAAFSWAGYSILYRSPQLQEVPNFALLGLVALFGAAVLAPVAAWEWMAGMPMPATATAWIDIAGIVVFASILAFGGFQYGIRALGSSIAGIFMYLLPPYGVLLAVLYLGEAVAPFHLAGIALVMGGVILATAPIGRRG